MRAETTTSNVNPLPVNRFSLHGLRNLNWAERFPGVDYAEHLDKTGFNRWSEPGPLAIIIGPNAGGKSTVIDLFRAIADASLWPSLARENYPGDDFSGFDIDSSKFTLTGRFSRQITAPEDIFEKLTIFARIGSALSEFEYWRCKCQAPKFPNSTVWATELQAMLDQHIGVKVHYYPPTGDPMESKIEDAMLVELLNEISKHLPPVSANYKKRFVLFKDVPGRIGVRFKDDPEMHSFVHRSKLPLGWMQFVSVLHFLRTCEPGSLVLLDEPDRHMHPSLKRVLLECIDSERKQLDVQIFLTTHSSVLINPELCQRVGASVIIASRGRCERLTDARRALDDLGVTSGDLIQANGVLWVEGPSDRIYIKRWLELYVDHLNRNPKIERIHHPLVEGIHYMIVPYGGSILKHISFSGESQGRIDIRYINRNFAVVIDSDCTHNKKDLNEEKTRLFQEATALNAEHTVWITQSYTIEAYLPLNWKHSSHIIEDSNGGVHINVRKVELAQLFAKTVMDWEDSYRNETDLPKRIMTLFESITAWQSPQEVIPPANLPPN